MNNKLRILCAILAIAMLLSFASCANSQEQEPSSSSSDSTTEMLEEVSTAEELPVEQNNYKKDFTIVQMPYRNIEWYYSDGLTGEILNDSVYNMMLLCYDTLGVTVKTHNVPVVTGGEIYTAIKPTYDSGDDVYQMAVMHPYYSINNLIKKKMVHDIGSFESIDTNKKYWNKAQMEALSFDGKQYLGLGSICLNQLNIIYANKQLATDVGVTIPYELVRNQEWTLDKFLEISDNAHLDRGNDGKDNKDRFGFACLWDANGSAFQQGCGIYTLTMNNDSKQFELTCYSDKTVEVFDKIKTLCTRDSSYIWDFPNKSNTAVIMKFDDGQILFTHDDLSNQYLNASFGVGILPMPKYDTAQKNYAHVDWGNLIMVPATVAPDNMNMVGDTIEYMAYYINKYTHPAYYETVLGARVADTADDWDMIQIIFDTVVYDPGIAFCDGASGLTNLTYMFCFAIWRNKPIASYYKTNEKSVKKELKRIFGYK